MASLTTTIMKDLIMLLNLNARSKLMPYCGVSLYDTFRLNLDKLHKGCREIGEREESKQLGLSKVDIKIRCSEEGERGARRGAGSTEYHAIDLSISVDAQPTSVNKAEMLGIALSLPVIYYGKKYYYGCISGFSEQIETGMLLDELICGTKRLRKSDKFEEVCLCGPMWYQLYVKYSVSNESGRVSNSPLMSIAVARQLALAGPLSQLGALLIPVSTNIGRESTFDKFELSRKYVLYYTPLSGLGMTASYNHRIIETGGEVYYDPASSLIRSRIVDYAYGFNISSRIMCSSPYGCSLDCNYVDVILPTEEIEVMTLLERVASANTNVRDNIDGVFELETIVANLAVNTAVGGIGSPPTQGVPLNAAIAATLSLEINLGYLWSELLSYLVEPNYYARSVNNYAISIYCAATMLKFASGISYAGTEKVVSNELWDKVIDEDEDYVEWMFKALDYASTEVRESAGLLISSMVYAYLMPILVSTACGMDVLAEYFRRLAEGRTSKANKLASIIPISKLEWGRLPYRGRIICAYPSYSVIKMQSGGKERSYFSATAIASDISLGVPSRLYKLVLSRIDDLIEASSIVKDKYIEREIAAVADTIKSMGSMSGVEAAATLLRVVGSGLQQHLIAYESHIAPLVTSNMSKWEEVKSIIRNAVDVIRLAALAAALALAHDAREAALSVARELGCPLAASAAVAAHAQPLGLMEVVSANCVPLPPYAEATAVVEYKPSRKTQQKLIAAATVTAGKTKSTKLEPPHNTLHALLTAKSTGATACKLTETIDQAGRGAAVWRIKCISS